MGPINVLMSVNKAFLKYSEEMIFSLLYYSSRPVNIYMMYIKNELNEDDIQSLKKFVSNYNGNLIPILFDATQISGVPTTIDDGSYFGLETYSRLFGAFKVPMEVEKLLYLDADMICTGDIAELYDINFDDKLWCAALDIGIEEEDLKRLQFSENDKYVNAGVLLINVKKFRQLYNESDMTNLIMKNIKFIKYCDQDFLNKEFKKTIKIIDSKYNLLAKCIRYKELNEKPLIVHYAGSVKPWHENVSRFEEEYLEPYYNALILQGNSKKEQLERLKMVHARNGYRSI